MTCVKTGAQVYFENYGYTVRADIYQIGDTYVIRWNVKSVAWVDTPAPGEATVVRWILSDHLWFHRDDLGITVVPTYLVDTNF